ncbi:unnamed protein product [Alopecurus aequalis]
MAAVVESSGGLAPFTCSPAVAKMLQRWTYQKGSGLGARGQGIVAPIQATEWCAKAGIGRNKKPYDNGLDAPAPQPAEEEWQKVSRALQLEKECCEKVLEILRSRMRQGDKSARTAHTLIVRSRKVFRWKNRTLGMWKASLPASTTLYIVEEVITPRLAAAARKWEPGWDEDCYNWLRPFIPLIGHLPVHLYGVVESNINVCSYGAVSPWKQYLAPSQWDTFTRRRVLPMLARAVREMKVTPPKQTDPSFRMLMFWSHLVRLEDVVSILEESFFDKWEDAIRHWMLAARPPLAEATAWCNGWKKLFTPELLADEGVLARLEAGLAVVDRAAQDLGYLS